MRETILALTHLTGMEAVHEQAPSLHMEKECEKAERKFEQSVEKVSKQKPKSLNIWAFADFSF